MKQNGGRGMMLALCGAVLLFVLLKNALVVFLARVQSRYQLEIYRDFSRRMFANYYHRGLLFLKEKSSVQLGHEVNYVCYMFCSGVLAPIFRMAGEVVLVLLMVSALIAWEPFAGFLLCASFFCLWPVCMWVWYGNVYDAMAWRSWKDVASRAARWWKLSGDTLSWK